MHVATSALSVFRNYIKYNSDGKLDVSGILTKECFDEWLTTRASEPKNLEEAFRKAVVGHCQGLWGRKPFPYKIEVELLKLLRKRRVWPCFAKSKHRIGIGGFRATRYWEKYSQKHRKIHSTSSKRTAFRPLTLVPKDFLSGNLDKQKPFASVGRTEVNWSENFFLHELGTIGTKKTDMHSAACCHGYTYGTLEKYYSNSKPY